LIAELETIILSFVQTFFDEWGWFGVAALLVIENATGITSSEIILSLAGWILIAEQQLSPSLIFLGGFYSAIASTFGASITYWATRIGGRPLVDRIAHWARIQPKHITRAEQQFHRWGAWLVLVGRVIPGIRILVSIPAGLSRMNFLKFLAATFVGSYIWCTLLISAGYLLGHQWPVVSNYVKQALPLLLFAGLLAIGVYLLLTRRVLSLAWAKIRNNDQFSPRK
jgi:membrane protein DedA with SNARE-associated domain